MKHEEIVALAFCIADEAMLELMKTHGVQIEPDLYGLVDESGGEVPTLDLADPAIEEAFEWLALRGLAELVTDEKGAAVRLKESK
ncbi:hypothetical protein [Paraburkholderia sacchari]|uniref:hypothetical protein n=1 Tax=Paraburkholderia sacchari TaxID=159450 RepID=UPI001BCE8A75|nr:hypothetical protein [Paraburkholderia sacchari]